MRTWWRPLCQSSAVHTPPGSQLWCGEGLVVLARPFLGDEGVAGAGDVAGIGGWGDLGGMGDSQPRGGCGLNWRLVSTNT